jgi:hypothetical protein
MSIPAKNQLEELERIAATLAVDVRYEAWRGMGPRSGGLCKLRGQYRVIMDRKLKPAERVQVLASALRQLDLAALDLSPIAARLLRTA